MNEKHRTSAPSRREFLQASTAAAVGAGLLLNERIARSAHAAATDETLRVGRL